MVEAIKTFIANAIVAVIAMIIVAFVILNAWGQYQMQEKIMAIPSDGDMRTVGQ